MKFFCEMCVESVFRLSSGNTAIVGTVQPDIEEFIPSECKADLYMNNRKAMTVNILGEDRFSGGDESRRKGRRAVRVDAIILEDLHKGSVWRLVIYK